MKLQIIMMTFLLLQPLYKTYGQPTGSEEFEKIHELIKPSVNEGYEWNTSQSSDSRFKCTLTYDLQGSELNRLIYGFSPNAKEFSLMAAALGGVEFDMNGRRAMYIDGKETGMSSISVLLNEGKGKFEVTHRDLGSMKPYSKSELLEIITKIDLDTLEK